jgi:hypothetical protein
MCSMPKKAPKSNVVVTFTGGGVLPERIPLRTLSRALSAVQQLVTGEPPAEDDEDQSGKNALHLLEVQRGSALFLCRAELPQVAAAHLRLVRDASADPDKGDRIVYALGAIETLSGIARSLNCNVTIGSTKGKDVLAKIEPGTYARLAKQLLVEGETSITGRVERAGGATANKCSLRLPDRSALLYCDVDGPDLARKLGEKLYEDVAVSGKARWIRGSWKLVSFTITSIYQPKQGDLLEAFDALRAAGGRAWAKVPNPKRRLAELTGE